MHQDTEFNVDHGFDIEISSYCQAFCSGCQRNTAYGEKSDNLVESHMSYDNFCYLMDSIDKLHSSRFIEFCGEMGDPMMHPDIERFIDRALQTTDKLLIHTNAGLRQPKWYTKIAEKHQDKNLQIKFGIDGCDHDTNWKYRKGVNWQRAMDNLKAWTDAGGKGHWAFLIFDWNYHQIPLAIKMAEEIGCKIEFHLTEDDNGRSGMTPAVLHSEELHKILQEHQIEFI